MKKICDEYMANNAWLTLDSIHSKRKRNNKQNELNPMLKPPPAPPPPAPPMEEEDRKPAAKTGRKKGSTIKAFYEKREKFIACKNEISTTWDDKTKRLKGLTCEQYILQTQNNYGLDPTNPDYRITPNMIYSRQRRGNLTNSGMKGQKSPLETIEPRLVQLFKFSTTDVNQEMRCRECVAFVNAYIEGSKLEQDIIDWKIDNHNEWKNLFDKEFNRPPRACITAAWFQKFVKRWRLEVSYSKTKNTAHYRKEHCTYVDFELMYDAVYGLLLKYGYAKKLPSPIYYDENFKQVENKDNAYGLPVDLEFTRPELILCADECGTNTNMSNDRMAGGNKRLGKADTNILLLMGHQFVV